MLWLLRFCEPAKLFGWVVFDNAIFDSVIQDDTERAKNQPQRVAR
jgi:hypothetical protein